MTKVDLLLGVARTKRQKKARRRAAWAVAVRHEEEFQAAYQDALEELRIEEHLSVDRRAET